MTTKVLSNDFMQRSLDTEAWKYITMEFNWTYELIEKFKDKIDWHELCYSSRIFWSIPFINKYKEYIDWDSLSTYSPSYMITEEYLEEFKDNWNKLHDILDRIKGIENVEFMTAKEVYNLKKK